MADYNSSHTGLQIDNAIDLVRNAYNGNYLKTTYGGFGTDVSSVFAVANSGKLVGINSSGLPVAVNAITGIPAGGSANQVLTKASATNYDVVWADASGGGGGSATRIWKFTSDDANLIMNESYSAGANVPEKAMSTTGSNGILANSTLLVGSGATTPQLNDLVVDAKGHLGRFRADPNTTNPCEVQTLSGIVAPQEVIARIWKINSSGIDLSNNFPGGHGNTDPSNWYATTGAGNIKDACVLVLGRGAAVPQANDLVIDHLGRLGRFLTDPATNNPVQVQTLSGYASAAQSIYSTTANLATTIGGSVDIEYNTLTHLTVDYYGDYPIGATVIGSNGMEGFIAAKDNVASKATVVSIKIDAGSDYSQISSKPQINGITLSGNKTTEELLLVNRIRYVDDFTSNGFKPIREAPTVISLPYIGGTVTEDAESKTFQQMIQGQSQSNSYSWFISVENLMFGEIPMYDASAATSDWIIYGRTTAGIWDSVPLMQISNTGTLIRIKIGSLVDAWEINPGDIRAPGGSGNMIPDYTSVDLGLRFTFTLHSYSTQNYRYQIDAYDAVTGDPVQWSITSSNSSRTLPTFLGDGGTCGHVIKLTMQVGIAKISGETGNALSIKPDGLYAATGGGTDYMMKVPTAGLNNIFVADSTGQAVDGGAKIADLVPVIVNAASPATEKGRIENSATAAQLGVDVNGASGVQTRVIADNSSSRMLWKNNATGKERQLRIAAGGLECTGWAASDTLTDNSVLSKGQSDTIYISGGISNVTTV